MELLMFGLTVILYLSTTTLVDAAYEVEGQRLCETNRRLCHTGLCPIMECLRCDKYQVICTTTNPEEVVPLALDSHMKFIEITYEGPPTKLTAAMFRHLPYVKNITIIGKNILSIAPKTFAGLKNLKWLKIYGAQVSQLPDELFYKENRLENLEFPFNQFSQFPVNVFPEVPHVKHIDFSYNPLVACSGNKSSIDVEFVMLTELNSLKLNGYGGSEHDCRHLNKKYFAPLKTLQHLDLSDSLIFYSDSEILLSLQQLTQLTMSHVPPFKNCPAIAKDIFYNLPKNLAWLRIERWATTFPANSSCFLTNDSISGLKTLKKLSYFDARYSDKIFGSTLTKGLFDGFQDIHTLYLGWCGIADIEEGVFDPLSKLVDFILDGNLLGPRTLSLYSKNTTSKVGNLQLAEIGVNTPIYNLSNLNSNFPNLRSLLLSKNHLTDMPLFRTSSSNESSNIMEKMMKLVMDYNQISNFSTPLAQDACKVMPQLSYLKIENNIIRDIDGICLSLTTLSLANNLIGKRPSKNLQALARLTNLGKLDLSNNQIDFIPKYLFKNMNRLKTLNLAQNNLQEIPDSLLVNNKALSALDLSSNFLSSVAELTIESLHGMRFIYFQDNKVTSISEEFINSIPNNFPDMIGFAVAGNPLTCSCKKYFKNWVMNSTIVMQPKTIMCSPPEANNGSVTIRVMDYSPDEFYCFIRIPLLVTGTIAAAIVVTLVIALPCYKYRWYISNCKIVFSAVVEKIQEVKFEQQCEYDAIVSYNQSSESDTEWVAQKLVPAVEESDETAEDEFSKRMKLFIADRDAAPGASTYSELCDTVKNSRKIIIILTNSYLSSTSCLHRADFLIGTARLDNSECYQPDRILVVILEELNEDIMVSPITSLLTSNANILDISKYQADGTRMRRVWKKVKNFISTPKYVYKRKRKQRSSTDNRRRRAGSDNSQSPLLCQNNNPIDDEP